MDAIDNSAASSEAAYPGEVNCSPSTGLVPDVFPEVKNVLDGFNLQRGVSTRNVFLDSISHSADADETVVRWHALRTTYGREKEACEFIVGHGGTAYCPSIKNMRLVDGKRRKVLESYVPNILFAYGSIDALKTFVYDNVNLPFLRFYYGYREVNGCMQKRPVWVPDRQMLSLKQICEAEAGGSFIPADKVRRFMSGDHVRVIAGSFKGVEGRVARYKGQQCVAVIISGLLTVSTAYIPTAFLQKIEN